MSRHPSPGPAPSQRTKSKPAMGITAGAEDVKYQGKYKELKRKVKEIEQDNDKLQFKVLQAKRNIQRMKLERAILYERLSSIPPSPELNNNRQLPVGAPPPVVRRSSANTDPRQLPPLSHLPPPPASPPRSRPSYHVYPENLPPMQQMNYSPDSRSRPAPPPLSPSARVHNHQRLGPGTYINEPRERERDRDRDMEWDREREREIAYSRQQREHASHSPTVHSRSHYQDHHMSSSRIREHEASAYYHETSGPSGNYPPPTSAARVSRSDTPGSGSGSGSGGVDIPSRPDSRGPYLERPFRLRPVEDPPLDFVHEDGRTAQATSRDRERDRDSIRTSNTSTVVASASGTRKRTRSDADMPMIDDSSQAPPVSYSGSASQRYHRGGDNMEDVRMGS
ncbi:hypothetical protein D9758_004854 [Tetrapyrgos nigripes]|uniref:INO80 complex subunit F domain-containing protein n=1 Tax=Tetrapyrgos nigripes TaxID=182062 RepID=A0A8H5G630_9AGAR|nr:hypothetical protein D9758_004854 [Tetrapyrgos nigripes]